jgi:hypothetical protein
MQGTVSDLFFFVVAEMDDVVLIVGTFVSAEVLLPVVIPGLLGMEGPGPRPHGIHRGEGMGKEEGIPSFIPAEPCTLSPFPFSS